MTIVGLLILLVTACSPAPAPVSQSPRDPSNPAAPEGAAPVAPASPATAAAVSTTSLTAADAGAAYVCPMHPEVTSDKPGLCPKCNMKLVPKK